MTQWIRRSGVLCMTFLCVSVFCQPTHAQQLVGQGEWQSLGSQAMGGTWSVELQQAGTGLRGTIKLTGSNMFSDSTVSGTIDGQQIVLGVMWEGAKEATFSGKLDGESISGEWECPAINDEGVWFGRLRARVNGP